jgi:hypothetical protein
MTAAFAMTLAEVAEALRLPVDEFCRRRAYLTRVGFPRHLPGLPLRWSSVQVGDWIAAGGVAAAAAPRPSGGPALIVDNANKALRDRYAGGLS